MRIIEFSSDQASPITLFESHAASSIPLAHGDGGLNVYAIHIEAGGVIGRHPTGFAQLFLVVQGTGWVEGNEGNRVQLVAGQGAYFDRGEMHAKGSDSGMLAIMVQAATFSQGIPENIEVSDSLN